MSGLCEHLPYQTASYLPLGLPDTHHPPLLCPFNRPHLKQSIIQAPLLSPRLKTPRPCEGGQQTSNWTLLQARPTTTAHRCLQPGAHSWRLGKGRFPKAPPRAPERPWSPGNARGAVQRPEAALPAPLKIVAAFWRSPVFLAEQGQNPLSRCR